MTSVIDGAKFFLDLAKAVVGWSAEHKKLGKEDAKDIAAYISEIADCLTEYGDLLSQSQKKARAKLIERRYYLDSTLSNLASTLTESKLGHRKMRAQVLAGVLKNPIDKLASIKVHDGALIPATKALCSGGRVDEVPPLSSANRKKVVELIHRAAGEFRAAASAIRVHGGA